MRFGKQRTISLRQYKVSQSPYVDVYSDSLQRFHRRRMLLWDEDWCGEHSLAPLGRSIELPRPGTEGNHKADQAANAAINQQIKPPDFIYPSEFEIPDWTSTLEGDVREEALRRLSKPFFRRGKGPCWVAPTLRDGNGVEEYEEEEDDRTVYHPVMTLKEAQQEDAQELRRYLAELECRARGLPINEDTSVDYMRKAKPLRHVYPQAKTLPPQMKRVKYAKIYRKVLDTRLNVS
ncbi:hypothetical protein IQ06DRAFT_302041 [Phaeosphaeriaceae sp. SRC1lsM3a]|nr:hypothetical protein IQ06DRAFT_302041 [Stagonospora sp. SRC1lsM3a]